MTAPSENETWLINRGDEIIEKKATRDFPHLSKWERLVYYLWIADYSIRNAGDLETGEDVCPDYLTELRSLANELGLSLTARDVARSDEELVQEYEHFFEGVCDEIKKAEPVA